ncbi:hypothetical protein BaRGS_00023584 [Batillaria attramentaria]|uniref:Major facilitator superfamily (MFS) profile domain-containing protein n=1 Tax=Batillaria attramentaria TaxID=370345 RepID=A0ABD0KDJ2_9CAEN
MKFDDVLREIGQFGPYQKRVYFLAAFPTALLAFETLSVIFIFYRQPHRCALPDYHGDTYNLQNDTHAMMINLTIPRTNGQWDECHVYNDVSYDVDFASNASGLTPYVTNGKQQNGRTVDVNTSRSACKHWVYDDSIFEATATSDFDVVCENSVQRAVSNMVAELGTMFGVIVCGFISDRFGRKVPFYVGGLCQVAGGFGIAFTQSLITFNVCRFILGIARICVFLNGLVIGMELVGPQSRTFAAMAIEIVWCGGELLLVLFAYFIRNWRWLEIALSIPSIVLLFYWWLIPESPRWLASRGREDEAMKVLERIAKSNNTRLPKIEDAHALLEADTALSFRNVVRSRELIVRMLIVFSNLLVIMVVYYGLTLNITNLSGDIFINFTLNVILEIVSYGIPYFLVDRIGRRPVYCASMILAGYSGGGRFQNAIPLLVMGSPALVVGILSLWLPETNGKRLPETLEDLEEMKR